VQMRKQEKLDKIDENGSLHKRIRELEALNAKLEDSGTRLPTLCEHAPDAYYLSDLEGTFVDGNAATEAITGYAKDELIGESFLSLNLLSPLDIPRAASLLARNVAGQSTEPEEFLLTRKDGTKVPVEVLTQPVETGGRALILGLARDITNREKADQALRESESRFRHIVESSPMGMHMYQIEAGGRLIFARGNQAADQILGVDHSRFTGKTIEEAFPPLAETEIPDRYLRAAAKGESWTTEQITYEDDQISGAFEVHAFQTEPGKMVAMFLDVTRRKQAEERDKEHYESIELLSETATRFVDFPVEEDIYEYIGDRIKELAGESIVVVNSINEAGDVLTNRVILGLGKLASQVAGLLGRNPRGMTFNPQRDELQYLSDRKLHDVNKSLYIILQKAVPKPICTALEKLYNIGKIYTMGFARKGRLLGTAVIFLPKGKSLGSPEFIETFINQASTALQRMQAVEALARSEERYRTFADNASDAFFLVSKDGLVLDVNEAACADSGYTRKELLNLSIANVDAAHSPVELSERFRNTPHDESFLMESIFRRKNGVTFPVEIRIRSFGTEDDPLYLALARDITDRNRATAERVVMEAHLRQSQKLESIGTLASGVAHEINNPLMGMMNYAELVKDKTSDPKAIHYLEEIGNEGNRIARIVKNLLSFSRQDTEALRPNEIADIIDGSLSLVGSLLRKDQIAIELDIPSDLPPLRCRAQQIQQVVINLLTNAHDALTARYPDYDEDKIVNISARLFEKEAGSWIRITIEDHGVGVSDEVAQQIFDPFFTTKPREEGTGLGLSVSFGIVKDHQGELTVEQVPGKYTRFHIDLPAAG
jgi:PAS domain S-box-containing protein